ncbi:ATP phosphoribosyltransferase regulatory subunit [Virgibacillus sp. MSP4-1]|uniref:ATP phosphoribosyltransferase regulatory subunit n=1 Tax=Virgibacillus sp. MSP4-1 TaxID=2700081 RepID=UPI00039D95DE|nr:ATP phosphoribosyltransferase regulatory subunit [Virgibacillus sp. MSP4-1]QHS24084.1 ATP phosphoribosyltransferase regulatory subunit [Virgibacillus sp. MSP4-1]
MLYESKRIPEGVSDLDSAALEKKETLISTLKQLYRQNGYRQVQTPIFEYYDLFLSIKGTIAKEKMIKLIDRDGSILVLRPDATLPIARMVATNYQSQDDSDIRLSYFTNIFRMNDREQDLQNRELTQAGIELFGRSDVRADVEVIKLAIHSLKELGFEDFKMDLGQANYFKELVNLSTITEEQLQEIRTRIENKNVSELQKILADIDVDAALKEAIQSMPLLYGEPEAVLEKAEKLALNEEMKRELDRLRQVYQELSKEGYRHYVSLDLGLINHLNYYTGIIFQGFIKNFGKPVVLGGRYDQLTEQFGADLPATGFGFYLDDLLHVMKDND